MIILIHTSKTMRPAATNVTQELPKPVLIDKTKELAHYLKTFSTTDIQHIMKVSEKMAITTKKLINEWTDNPQYQRAAIDSFIGDIYSGLQVSSLNDAQRQYADEHLRILSGLYGVLKPLDGIYPYRFEMGYKVTDFRQANLYTFWGTMIADALPKNEKVIDLTAVEYGKTVTRYIDSARIITPRFLTISPKTGEPNFVVVHAKIARGAFARWMIQHHIEDMTRLEDFTEIGYVYSNELSTKAIPVFVCRVFEGLGLSVRLS